MVYSVDLIGLKLRNEPINDEMIMTSYTTDSYTANSHTVVVKFKMTTTSRFTRYGITVKLPPSLICLNPVDIIAASMVAILSIKEGNDSTTPDMVINHFFATPHPLMYNRTFMGISSGPNYIPLIVDSREFDKVFHHNSLIIDPNSASWSSDDGRLLNYLAETVARSEGVFEARTMEEGYTDSSNIDLDLVASFHNGSHLPVQKSLVFYNLQQTNIKCRKIVKNSFNRLFSRMNKQTRLKTLFDPADSNGQNCFEACFRKHCENYNIHRDISLPSRNGWSMDQIIKFLDNKVDYIIAIVDKSDGKVDDNFRLTGVTSSVISDYTRVVACSKSQNNPIRLLVMPNGEDMHCILYFKAVAAFHSARCAKCGAWQDYENIVAFKQHMDHCTKCICGQYILDNGAHAITCVNRPTPFSTKHPKDCVRPRKVSNSESQTLSNQYFADFETLVDDNGIYQVYAWAVKDIAKDETRVEIGNGCIKLFIDWLLSDKANGHIWFHNGSGFDVNFVLSALVTYKTVTPIELVKKGNKVLAFSLEKHRSKITFRDSFLFLPSSLARLCKDFKVPDEISKGDIDHSTMTWEMIPAKFDEIKRYITNDVLSLEFIYKKFSEGLWNICNQPMFLSMSLASHASSMWLTMEDSQILSKIHIPDGKVLYPILRSMYFGGRVMATRRIYKPVKHGLEDKRYWIGDKIDLNSLSIDEDDYLVDVDVVSLYPSMMHKHLYPVGRPTLQKVTTEASEKTITVLNNAARHGVLKKVVKNIVFSKCYLVDVAPPTNIYASFLMRRTSSGSVLHSLEPIERQWITGIELWESSKIGYSITRIYEELAYPQLCAIYTKYIGKLFEIKNKYKDDKSNVNYIAAKWAMNSLSGKFGQKKVDEKTWLSSNFDDIPGIQGLLALNAVCDQDGEEKGYLYTMEDIKENPSQPTQLSVWILAYARRHMSRIIRRMGGYTNPGCTYYYTDTDSLIVHKSAYDMIPRKFIGSNLGQLEDELGGKKILQAVFLAPKTYALSIVDSEGNLFYKIRCKGIPHRGDLIRGKCIDEEYGQFDIDELLNSPVDFKKKTYLLSSLESEDEKPLAVPYISTPVMEMVLKGDTLCDVIFGSMQKGGASDRFTVAPAWRVRGLSIESWWEKDNCPRTTRRGSDIDDITLCAGQTDYIGMVEDVFLDLDLVTQNQEECLVLDLY